MLSRTLLNIVLLILVVLLAIYVFKPGQDESHSLANERLTQLTADEVVQININHNQRRIQLVRKNDKWHMTHPVDIDANSFRIDTLLKMLESASHTSYPASELELDKYGLSSDGTSISFNNVTIEFGIVNPINNYRYVQSGNMVHLIDDHFYPLLSSQIGTLVARELISSDADIEKLVLPQHNLYRDEKNNWRSSNNLDPDVVNEILYHWQNSQAFGVHNYMPRESVGEISVFLAGHEKPVRFNITDTDPWLIIARPELNIEYHFNLEFYDRLLGPGAASESGAESGE